MRRPYASLTFLLSLPVLLGACSGGSAATPAPSPTIEGVQVYPGLSHDHLKDGEAVPTYPQSPAVGGKHNPVWVTCRAYDVPVPDMFAVHSMEHGGVWVTYRPDLSPADVAAVTGRAERNSEFVLVSPYPGQDAPVVVTAWGLQLITAGPADARIDAFIDDYAGGDQGGEAKARCASTGATLEQAQQLEAKRLAS